jgi:dynein heavy chain
MLRLYGQKTEFTPVEKHREFRKAVYGLCFFHTILIERKKFKTLGWNVNYAFNDSDYSVCEDILAIYMGQTNEEGKPIDEAFDKKTPIPWPAIQSLIADCNYGGRITDNMDRRLIGVYAKEIFNDNLVSAERWKPNNTDENMNYMYPFDETAFKHPDPTQVFTPSFFYEELMAKMNDLDPPEVYGQYINAEISS